MYPHLRGDWFRRAGPSIVEVTRLPDEGSEALSEDWTFSVAVQSSERERGGRDTYADYLDIMTN